MSVTFPQKYDSMRWTQTLVDEAGASGPDAASLAAIESLMLTANTAFWNRHYAEAIDDYKQAAAKIYSGPHTATPPRRYAPSSPTT
jgi:hypothetical protein